MFGGFKPHTKAGERPTRGDQPYRYSESDSEGESGGFGLGNGPLGSKKDKAKGSILNFDYGRGRWEGSDGETNYGIKAEAGVLKRSWDVGGAFGPFGPEFGALTASAGASANNSSASIGAQANIVEGAVTLGNEEHNIRAGASVGVGFAGRLHYGDADNDGLRERGIGVDIGPFSGDIKSEEPDCQISPASPGCALENFLHWADIDIGI